MNIADEEFDDEFQTFGHSIDNPDLYDTMRTFCQQYRMDASDIAMEWVAFSQTNKHCKLNGESLDHMERARLSKRAGKVAKTPKPKSVKEPVYDINSLENVLSAEAEDLVGAYATPKGKGSNKRQHTPDQPVNKRVANLGRSPALNVPFSPSSLSPANATPSKKYSSRSNQGEVVLSFGDCKKVTWKTNRTNLCSITPFDKDTTLTGKFKYMFQKLSDKAIILNETIEHLSEKLQKHHGVSELGHVALPLQVKIQCSTGVEVTQSISSVPLFSQFFRIFQTLATSCIPYSYLTGVTHSLTAVTPIKYECDFRNLNSTLERWKIFLIEKLKKRPLATPTPV